MLESQETENLVACWMWPADKSEKVRPLERSKVKVVGEPYEGKPHVRFEVAGDGNQDKYPRRHPLTLQGDGE